MLDFSYFISLSYSVSSTFVHLKEEKRLRRPTYVALTG